MYDCIIIGAGHNGLVAANYLARDGWKVLVLERRELVGGACVTESLWPGYRVSTASYVVSLLLPEIERELRLADYGYKVLPRSPSSFTPLEDGRSLTLGPDAAQNAREIARFSTRDAEAFPRYEALLEQVAAFLEPTLGDAPPNLLPLPHGWRRRSPWQALRELWRGWKLLQGVRARGAVPPPPSS